MLRTILSTLTGWVTGPITRIGEKYVEGRNNANMLRLENEAQRDFLRKEIETAMLEDDFKRQEVASAILRRDRGDWKTSWIRPVTAGLALMFWIALTLSQIRWVGYSGSDQLLPIIWNIPPAGLGQMFIAFPMGMLATFYIARPFEKFFIGRTGL